MKRDAYRVFVDIWRLAYTYGFQKLDEKQWDMLISDGKKLYQRYKGSPVEILLKYLYRAVSSYYEELEKRSQ